MTRMLPLYALTRASVPLAVIMALLAPAAAAQEIEVDAPNAFLTGIPFTISVHAPKALDSIPVRLVAADGTVMGAGTIPPTNGVTFRDVAIERGDQLPLTVEGLEGVQIDRPLLPGWFSLIPALVAIALALIFHEVVSSLFAGVVLGALLLHGYNPIKAVLAAVDSFVHPALADGDHASIVIFSLLLGGMVGIMTRMGGTKAIVDVVTPLATSRRRGLFATWVAGLAIFFDDYANTLVVGNTMRPLTDRLKISREKLAYIVDSTAAPVTVIVFVSTWVGFELGLIGDALGIASQQSAVDPAVGAVLAQTSPFSVYLQSVPYLFYPILAIFFVALVIWTKRDFGPMLEAERRAVSGGGLHRPGAQLAADPSAELGEAPEGTPLRWWNGALPVIAVVTVVVAGLISTGLASIPEGDPAGIKEILGEADPYISLLWGSLTGCIVGIGLAVGQRILPLKDAVSAWAAGIRAMMLAMVILVLAWSLGGVTEALGAPEFLSTVISDRMSLRLLPAAVFVVSGLMAFATGTSWATMTILFPLVIPLAVIMGGGIGADGTVDVLLLGSVASVMAGSIFGDHCSPISDTTVLSSTASGCDHVDHVRTQLPYALVIGGVTLVFGNIGTAYGLPVWAALLLCAVTLWAVVRFLGKDAEQPA